MTASLQTVACDDGQAGPHRFRWWILVLLFLQTALCYLDRQTLSVLSPILRDVLGMSNTAYSNVLNCYFFAYTLMYFGGGRIMDKFGAFAGMAVAVLFWATAGAMHALIGSVFALAACRFLLAIGEGPVPPGCAKTVSEWFPSKERGLATSVWLMGATIGATVAPVIVIWIYHRVGWRYAFVVTASLGYLWAFLWIAFKRKWVSRSESGKVKSGSPPLRELFRHREVWGIMMLRFFLDPVWFFYIFWLPEYLVNGKGLEMKMVGMLAWIPFLAADFGTLAGGSLASWLQHRGWTVSRSHKTVMVFSALMMMVGVTVPFLTATWHYLAAMCVSIVGMQMFGSNNHALPTQFFPSNTVGTVAGIAGGCAGIGSMLLTRFVGVSVDMTGSYIPVFCVVGLFYPVMLLVALGVVGEVKRLALTVEDGAHALKA